MGWGEGGGIQRNFPKFWFLVVYAKQMQPFFPTTQPKMQKKCLEKFVMKSNWQGQSLLKKKKLIRCLEQIEGEKSINWLNGNEMSSNAFEIKNSFTWWQFHQRVCAQLLWPQITKAQKAAWVGWLFLHFWDLPA